MGVRDILKGLKGKMCIYVARTSGAKPSEVSNSDQEKKLKYPTVWLGSSDGW